MRGWVLLLGLAGLLAGCSPAWYRRDADRETYADIQERLNDPRWFLPRISIDTPPQSRLHDPYNPDRPPLPPDDPAAARYMEKGESLLPCQRYDKDGLAPFIEDPAWQAFLPLEPDGTLRLTPARAVEIALLNSRAYQRELENLYLNALALTLNQFEFDLHWFFRNGTFYDHFGSSSVPGESNTLSTSTTAGFTRAFACGGELLVSLANSFVWEYTSTDRNFVSSNVFVSFIQPVLRQAGRRVRLENLIEAERDLLYAVRDFARFRKQFSVDLLTSRGGGYLALLLQVQNIRNLQANLASREQNLRLHEALLPLGNVAAIQVDQAFQSYQAGRLLLLQAETAFANSLDVYKISLGLPPTVPIQIDDGILSPFQLSDPELTKLQDELEKFHTEFREPVAPPPVDKLRDGFRRLLAFHSRTVQLRRQVDEELVRWKAIPSEPDAPEADVQREQSAQQSLGRQLEALRTDLQELQQAMERSAATLQENTRKPAWEALQRHIRQEIAAAAQVFVIQNQVRVYLIHLRPVRLDADEAIEYALSERLDVMNLRGRVTDAWRQLFVAANALKSDLNVRVEADVRTAADASNPFDFAASNSRYRVGFEFDGPLNRVRERNIYRATLINYQRSRREFMASEDQVRQAIRRDLRQLQTERLNFEIARQSLIVAARQVEAARERLLIAERGQDTSSTRDTIEALNALLGAKDALIASWVNYQTSRIQLLLDLEALQVDDRGMYRDDQDIDLRRPGSAPAADAAQPAQPGNP
jgi:outer membrane protein TolC